MIKKTIQAGVNASWTYSVNTEFSGFQFEYILIGPQKITIPTTVNHNECSVDIKAAETAPWLAGLYQYALYAFNGDDRHLIDSSTVEILADFQQLAVGYDPRTHTEKMLEAIKSVLEGRIVKDVESYTIDDRTLNKIPILELHKLKRQYQVMVNREKNKQAGKPSFQPKVVKVRFK